MKFAIALAALLGVGTAPALAGDFYTNVETNGSYTGSDFTSRTTDLHLGYEGDPMHIAEELNGRLAMMGFVAALGAYVFTGQVIPGIF